MGSATSNTLGPVIASSLPSPAPPLTPPPTPSPTPVPPAVELPTVFTPISPPPPPIPPALTPATTGGGPGLGGCGLPGRRFYQSYAWKFLVANLNLETITMLDRLASGRRVVKTLNDALETSLRVPSNNIRVNIPYTDGDPKVDEGTRLLIGFRHEGSGVWTCRSTGIVMQAHDAPDGETVMTEITAWDPWRYLDFLPIINPDQILTPNISLQGVTYFNDNYLGLGPPAGVTSWSLNDMVFDILTQAEANYNTLFTDYGQSGSYTGNLATPVAFPSNIPSISFQNGSSVGQALRDLVDRGWIDVVFEPLYDPVSRPGLISQLSIYSRLAPGTGVGVTRPAAIMGWDEMPRSLASIDRLQDGTQRANHIQYYHSRGGPPVALKMDPVSLAKYNHYFQTKFFPIQGGKIEELEELATAQLLFRQSGVETITVTPAAGRAKVPLLDYDIGDTIPVFVSDNLRKTTSGYYRVMQIPLEITDEANEQASDVTLKFVGELPIFDGPVTQFEIAGGVSLQTQLARRTPRSFLPGP